MGATLKQVELALWFEGQNPATDAPFEAVCLMQDTLESTVARIAKVLERHWNGDCACQAPAHAASTVRACVGGSLVHRRLGGCEGYGDD